jgi:putative endopeptidase
MTFRVALVVTVLAGATLLGGQSPAKSGLDLGNIDGAVRPQDDRFRYANGRWLATAEIPSDRVTLGTFAEMAERTDLHLRAIAEEPPRSSAPSGTPGDKLYRPPATRIEVW